jgi:hypothetical protein
MIPSDRTRVQFAKDLFIIDFSTPLDFIAFFPDLGTMPSQPDIGVLDRSDPLELAFYNSPEQSS